MTTTMPESTITILWASSRTSDQGNSPDRRIVDVYADPTHAAQECANLRTTASATPCTYETQDYPISPTRGPIVAVVMVSIPGTAIVQVFDDLAQADQYRAGMHAAFPAYPITWIHHRVIEKMIIPLFSPGHVVITPAARDMCAAHGIDPRHLLERHLSGDWGDLLPADQKKNNAGVNTGDRLLSSYPVADPDDRVWLITEGDRSVTTIMLPDDY